MCGQRDGKRTQHCEVARLGRPVIARVASRRANVSRERGPRYHCATPCATRWRALAVRAVRLTRIKPPAVQRRPEGASGIGRAPDAARSASQRPRTNYPGELSRTNYQVPARQRCYDESIGDENVASRQGTVDHRAQFYPTLTLDGIAAACGVSRSHLAHAFGTATGLSVMQYERARRLSATAQALAAGARNILSLALEAGYGRTKPLHARSASASSKPPRACASGAVSPDSSSLAHSSCGPTPMFASIRLASSTHTSYALSASPSVARSTRPSHSRAVAAVHGALPCHSP